MKFSRILLLLLAITSLAASCHRSGGDNASDFADNTARITADAPFEGQPNTFCTVVRKVPGQEINRDSSMVCLLDVCLDDDETPVYSINLGTKDDPVMAYYKLIKVFESPSQAMVYASEYGIQDVLID